jgi:hypothetical protein
MQAFASLRDRIKTCKGHPGLIPRLIAELKGLVSVVKDALEGRLYKTELFQLLSALGFLYMVKGVSGQTLHAC